MQIADVNVEKSGDEANGEGRRVTVAISATVKADGSDEGDVRLGVVRAALGLLDAPTLLVCSECTSVSERPLDGTAAAYGGWRSHVALCPSCAAGLADRRARALRATPAAPSRCGSPT